MPLPVIGTFIDAGMKILDRVLPNPEAKAAAQLELLKLHQAGEFKEMELQVQRDLAQIEINKAEAANPTVFVSGWRPFIGWVCGVGLGTQFLIAPFATWVAKLRGYDIAFPELDMGTLMTLLAGMLGLGAMRTTEKINKVAAK